VASRQSTVVINGNSYDASTGQIIDALKTANSKTTQVIDGFVSGPIRSVKVSAAERRGRKQVRAAEVHHRTQKGSTLMRGGLKRPDPGQQPHLTKHTGNPKIDTQLRAKTSRLHHRVNRFGNPIRSAARQPQAVSGEVIRRRPAAEQAVTADPLPSMVSSVSHQKLERLLDEALTRADAHKQALRYHAARHFWQRRWFSGPRRWLAVAGALLCAVIALFVSWQRVPQLSVKVAGMKAHVSAAVPAYKPDGFTLASPAKADSGTVKVEYKSAADPSQKYVVTQASSGLTSSSISQNVVPKGTSVQTSQVDGNTVYIYGPHNDAAWVNNGVLYKIKDNANLSSDQVLKIVSSINP
jgi:hypothetical protein